MELDLKPGKYVLAVSGGVDSMVLLDMLRQQPEHVLTVAHLDHGIREDSAEDRRLVQQIARRYGLPFVYQEAWLGTGASEAAARSARYTFLGEVQRASGARAIVTAHHQDDVLETAIINLLRGTGRKGLTALSSRPGLERPLLELSKSDLLAYAQDRQLVWREDSTNQNIDYLRNYVRRQLLPRFGVAERTRLLALITDLRATNAELDTLLVNHLHAQSAAGMLDRQWFSRLPHKVASETMAAWLRANEVRDFDRPMLERLVVAAKVAPRGKKFDVLGGVQLLIQQANLALVVPER